ncbi:MAG: ABC transporter permease [Bacteroidaceae bacterium]|nr:ABC transporter permease [Bacteroidaceae bacterium]
MNLELFIAQRLYGTRKGARRISRPAVAIAQWGVAIGAVIMIASICIIVGFKQQVREKLYGFGGHIQIMSYSNDAATETPLTADSALLAELHNIPNIAHIQQYTHKQGLIVANDEYEGVVIKGVCGDYDLSLIESHVVEGKIPQFCDTASSGSIVLSQSMAGKLKAKVGDKINIYFLDKGIRARKQTVAAIYNTHLTEFDNTIAFTDIYTTRSIHDWECNESSAIEIHISDYSRLEQTRDLVTDIAIDAADRNDETLSVPTIEELNMHMFEWLALLDQTVWLILILVVCIAAFTMVSGLLIIILEKSNLIGILKATGAKDYSIRRIFIYYASFIIGRGIIIGNIIGLLLCYLQQQFKIVAIDPEMYYMDRVPIEFSWLLVPMNIAMFIISVAALVLPSMLISTIEPTKAIKFE